MGPESRGSSHDYSPRSAEGQGINKLKRPQPGKRPGVQMARVRGQGVSVRSQGVTVVLPQFPQDDISSGDPKHTVWRGH